MTSFDHNLLADCRWVLFDAVGTLIQPDPPIAVAYQQIAARHGARINVRDAGNRFGQAFRQSEQDHFPGGPPRGSHGVSTDEIELARWRWIVSQVVPDVEDPDACFQELWDHFAKPSAWSCFDDVEACLIELRRAGFHLGIASNFDARLHTVCAGHPALQPIKQHFVSTELGFRKPSSDFYRAILSQCDCPPEQILMIGDDPHHDVAPARQLGMRAILIDRHGKWPDSDKIQSFVELHPPH